MYYHSKTSPLRFAPVYVQLACFSGLALLMSVLCYIGYIQCLPSKGEADILASLKYSLQGTTQGRYLTGGVPPVRFSM